MTKKELVKFLKENLTITVDYDPGRSGYSSTIEVSLDLCGEEIASSGITCVE